MFRPLTFLFFLVLPTIIWTQEICDNGIDDDNDSFIDYDDPDCMCCADSGEELFGNRALQDNTCCDDLQCYDYWHPNGATEVYNPGCGLGLPSSLPQPVPEGWALVHMQTGSKKLLTGYITVMR